jgi:hypothetical protein
LELEPEVFQGEQKRMRRLLVLGLTKKTGVTPERESTEARDARAATAKATLVGMLS